MKGYAINIEHATKDNTAFRQVLYTGRYTQLVVMSIEVGEDIGNEVHGLDQFIRVESGKAKALLNNGETEYRLEDDWALIIPAGMWHNIINTGAGPLQLYSLYSPPEHRDDTIHPSKAEAEEERFDGKTSE